METLETSGLTAGLTETDADVKRRLGLALGRLEAAREELSVGTKGPGWRVLQLAVRVRRF